MSLFIKQFKEVINYKASLYACYSDQSKRWRFNQDLIKQPARYFEAMVLKHRILDFQHRAFSHYLLTKEKSQPISQDELCAILVMTELLIQINLRLNVQREIIRLTNLQKKIRQQLTAYNFKFDNDTIKERDADKISVIIRTSTAKLNWYRQFLLRFIRLLTSIQKVVESTNYIFFVDQLNHFTGRGLSYFSWLFYLPRLTINGLILLAHLPDCLKGSREERDMSRWVIQLAQLLRRWTDLANDIVWFLAAVACCFLLIGRLAPVSAYLNCILYGYDVAVAVVRAWYEISGLLRIKSQIKNNLNILEKTGTQDLAAAQERAYLNSVNQLIHHEIMRLCFNIFSASCLFFAFIPCLPLFAFNPIIPLTGAVVLVAITLLVFAVNKTLDKKKPATDLVKLSLFKPGQRSKDCGTLSVKSEEPSPSSQPNCNVPPG